MIIVLEHITAPRNQHPKGISNFRSLLMDLSIFSRIAGVLEAEQWLVEMKNLLKTTRVLNADKIDVIKIQLADIARTWWQLEENRLTQPICGMISQ